MIGATGIGTYLQNMLPRVVAARPGWRFTVLGRTDELSALGLANSGHVELRPAASRVYSIGEQIELARCSPRRSDLFWSPHYNIPLVPSARLVVTIHDVMHLSRPEYTRTWARRRYARAMFSAVRRRASAVVCVSDFTRREFTRLVGSHPATTVVHNGVEPGWFDVRCPARVRAGPYVLFVGSSKPHKNLVGLLRGFALVKSTVPHDLVVVSAQRDSLRTVDSRVDAEAALLDDRVILLHGLELPELQRLVAGADLVVQPSVYEGFGLPPLEAMAAGTPCLVARIDAFAEVCGDAVEYCDPHDPRDIAAKLAWLLMDDASRNELRARGRLRARQFAWDVAAERMLAVFEKVLDT